MPIVNETENYSGDDGCAVPCAVRYATPLMLPYLPHENHNRGITRTQTSLEQCAVTLGSRATHHCAVGRVKLQRCKGEQGRHCTEKWMHAHSSPSDCRVHVPTLSRAHHVLFELCLRHVGPVTAISAGVWFTGKHASDSLREMTETAQVVDVSVTSCASMRFLSTLPGQSTLEIRGGEHGGHDCYIPPSTTGTASKQ